MSPMRPKVDQKVSPILTNNRFRRFSPRVSVVSGVSLVGVPLLSASVAVAVLRPEVISERLSSPEVKQGPIGKLSWRRIRSYNNPESAPKKIHIDLYDPPSSCPSLIYARCSRTKRAVIDTQAPQMPAQGKVIKDDEEHHNPALNPVGTNYRCKIETELVFNVREYYSRSDL
jgi:hypothetical protein